MCVEHALKGKGGRKKSSGELKKAMELAKREGGEKEEEMGVWRRDKERRIGEWEKRVQRLGEKVEKREKRGEGQEESGRDESPGKREKRRKG